MNRFKMILNIRIDYRL